MSKIIRVDMDGVLADLHTPWLDRINQEHGCNVCVGDLTTWGFKHLLPVAAQKTYYKHLHELDLYDDVEPYPEALEGVQTLRDAGYRVLFVTSSTPAGAYGKMLWLKRHKFVSRGEAIPKDFISAHDKTVVAPFTPLVDDGIHNVKKETFGILFDQPWNQKDDYPRRAHTWEEALEFAEATLLEP